MFKPTKKQLITGAVGLTLLILIIIAFQPSPIPIQAVEVVRAPLQVTLEEEGYSEVCECFQVAAPISGTLHRIDLKEGASLKQGETLCTMSPPPLNPRERKELKERVLGGEQTMAAAKTQVNEIMESLGLARQNQTRYKNLLEAKAISQEKYDEQSTQVEVLEQQLQSAKLRANASEYELGALKAALYSPDNQLLKIKAPISGTLLRLHEKSERVVQAGTPIATLGDNADMEIVVDVLSTDAVKVEPGQKMMIENWGGENSLEAVVDRIEPAAFTKISALGIEEKRVNVYAKLKKFESRLGDNFRVEVKIILWDGRDVLQIPQNALFRDNSGWAVFKVNDDKAEKTAVEIGKRSRFNAQVLEGLSEGDQVISHPPNDLEDGSPVEVERK